MAIIVKRGWHNNTRRPHFDGDVDFDDFKTLA